MTIQLPAHLQNRQVRSLTERASEGMGSTLPPHVSLAGNSFTFIDAAGNEFKPMLTFDAVIVDISDRMNKRYYDKPYNPKETGEAPRCWSANGITPSREVAVPIAPECEGCRLNIRGSAVSQISGAAIKACRDEKWIAFIVPQMPTVIFQLVITPGSFNNWKAYTETMRANGAELSFAITRFSFVPGSTGELLFEFVGWIDEQMVQVVEAANREGKTDALVGRSDPVRQPALAAPQQAQTLPPPNQFAAAPGGAPPATRPQQEVIPPGQLQGALQAPFGQAGTGTLHPAAAAVATSLSTGMPAPSFSPAPALSAPTISPSEAAPRRRRRTAAKMTAAEMTAGAPAAGPGFGAAAGAAPQAPFGQPTQAAPAAAPQAPFGRPVPTDLATAPVVGFGQTTGGGGFGIQPGAPVNPEMLAMLESMGLKRAS